MRPHNESIAMRAASVEAARRVKERAGQPQVISTAGHSRTAIDSVSEARRAAAAVREVWE
jgi:hypothetical protein